jgi:biotin operon repressor
MPVLVLEGMNRNRGCSRKINKAIERIKAKGVRIIESNK